MATKQQLIMEEIVLKYHPDFQEPHVRAMARRRPDLFNVERLVEECMCNLGGYEFVDQHHYDNSDYSDTKTATISERDCTATVNAVLSESLTPKAGDLRVVLYNPFHDRLDYYFMPKAGWESIREYGEANRRRLRAKYNPDSDTVYKWSQWRVDSFETLAKTPATVTAANSYTPALTPLNTLFDWSA